MIETEKTDVIFYMNDSTIGCSYPFVYFPNVTEDMGDLKAIFTFDVGHSSVNQSSIKSFKRARKEQYLLLQARLEHLGYRLNVINEMSIWKRIKHLISGSYD